MKIYFRVLIAVLLAPIWIPGALVWFVIISPYWVIGALMSAGGFVISGEWEWPEIG